MNADLQTRIAAIKAACEKVIELDELASAGPWLTIEGKQRVISDDGGEVFRYGLCSKNDCDLIAHYRNVSPAMSRVVLAALECLENQVNEPGWSGHMCDNDGMGCPACYIAEKCLESIAEQWEGK